MRRTRAALVALVLFLLFAGCASVPPAVPSEKPRADAPHGHVAKGPSGHLKSTPSASAGGGKIVAKALPSDAKTLAKASVSASPAAKQQNIASEPTKQNMSPPLDLTSLEQRLKQTHAIDVLDKIAFKNQVDDLLNQFRAFYKGTLKTSLIELRRPYDLLVLELLSMLRDKDPSLADEVVASREAIWVILADPAKFATI